MKLLSILTIIFSFNTIQAGLIYEYFEDGTKRINNFTGTVEWYREKEYIKSAKQWKGPKSNKIVTSLERALWFEINEYNDFMKIYNSIYDNCFEKYDVSKYLSNKRKKNPAFANLSDFSLYKKLQIDGDTNLTKLAVGKIEGEHKSSLYVNIFRGQFVNYSDLKNCINSDFLDQFNKIKDSIVQIEDLKIVYPKGWTTEKKYLK